MTPADEDAQTLLRLAVDAAGEAGALLASWRGDIRPEVIDTKSSPTDVVTEMDRRSEALITERIREARPLSKLKRWALEEIVRRSSLGQIEDAAVAAAAK